MVRAPCCEKMGLKKGPWTPDEDDVLVSYIQKHGHGNWRALPKQAGLLRCGKSCRLRWTNYLRPDIKRGNYSKEEEDTIISLHEMLGNRWSAIAARLPGRTDNEIKNVWHTHLKKRVKQNHEIQESKPKARCKAEHEIECNPRTSQLDSDQEHLRFKNTNLISVSRTHSYSEFSCSGTKSSTVTGDNYSAAVKEERIDSSEEFPEIDESFWSEALSMQNFTESAELKTSETSPYDLSSDPSCSFSTSTEDMSFWLRIFIEAGDAQDLPDI